MAIRKKGRSVVVVGGRRFVWHIHRDTHMRIASEDKRFVVSYCLINEPELRVCGPEFPGVSRSQARPVLLRPPTLPSGGSMAELARQVIRWALFSGEHLNEQGEPRLPTLMPNPNI